MVNSPYPKFYTLKNSDKLTTEWFYPYVLLLRDDSGIRREEVLDYCKKYFQKGKLAELMGEEQKQLIAWMSISEEPILTMDTKIDPYITDIAKLTRHQPNDILEWAICNFGEKYAQKIERMNMDDVAKDVALYLTSKWVSERKRITTMKKAILLTLTIALMASVASSQVLNSDPDFKREGKRPYTCTTPKGRHVKCNKWSFSKGWKKARIPKNKSPFSKLATREAHTVDIRRPDSGVVALYDYEWSDHRDVNNISPKGSSLICPFDDRPPNQLSRLYCSGPRREDYYTDEEYYEDYDKWEVSFEEEVLRPLQPATFQQYLELKEEGSYELKACMSGYFPLDRGNADIYYGTGMVVKLMEWHKDTVNMPTIHAVVPEVPGNLLEPAYMMDIYDAVDHSNYLGEVNTVDMLPTSANKYDRFFVWSEFLNYIYSGKSWQAMSYEPHVGHAGLGTEYPELYPQTEGVWTCHTQVVGLAPGFYVLQGEALPFTTDDDYDYTDYDGWGAIRTVTLRKLP